MRKHTKVGSPFSSKVTQSSYARRRHRQLRPLERHAGGAVLRAEVGGVGTASRGGLDPIRRGETLLPSRK